MKYLSIAIILLVGCRSQTRKAQPIFQEGWMRNVIIEKCDPDEPDTMTMEQLGFVRATGDTIGLKYLPKHGGTMRVNTQPVKILCTGNNGDGTVNIAFEKGGEQGSMFHITIDSLLDFIRVSADKETGYINYLGVRDAPPKDVIELNGNKYKLIVPDTAEGTDMRPIMEAFNDSTPFKGVYDSLLKAHPKP